MDLPCPLCNQHELVPFYRDPRREYLRCGHCQLISVPAHYHLSEAMERHEYDLHINSPEDEGYRHFLNRLLEPMNATLPPGSSGLDFGSGPGPTLSLMFKQAGHRVSIYDKFYAPDSTVFEQPYDFITATEVVEHLQQPITELERLWHCLKPGGVLGIMTKLALDRERFAHWHYKNDLTHISFFSRESFEWLSLHWEADLQFIANDVILLHKPTS
ncbi:hypothetical protein BOW53_13515 [Solemya pervernicosa gill symbiont]|uniref:Methyltransferase n=1 Tax=Solemya pervernicosa gill symbiont TaxID=642797 RepID=A0A1T2L1H7_9GAMM|nr:hypothetical protein BOW53_13515 [Solemya pervernicosa gill symbiont]